MNDLSSVKQIFGLFFDNPSCFYVQNSVTLRWSIIISNKKWFKCGKHSAALMPQGTNWEETWERWRGHYVEFRGASGDHYKPLTIFIPWNIQAALFPVSTQPILEVKWNQTKSNMWTYGRSTDSTAAGQQPGKDVFSLRTLAKWSQ